jgi:ATP-dependent DNA helicase RecQ
MADRTGGVQLDAANIAAALPGKVSDREVESALRLLMKVGALRSEPDNGTRVFIRLLATTERIKNELGPQDAQKLELLRSLWRIATDALYDGTTIDLATLPGTFGGAFNAMELLSALERTQFLEWNRLGGGDRVADMRRPLSGYPLDWDALDRRRKAETSKLDSMQQYAYASGCRRGFVLRYFGDPAAGKDCGGCDNCLGTHDGSRRGKPSVGVPKAGVKARVRGGVRTASSAESSDLVASAADAALLERLRALRSSIAREQKVPAYVVFADKTLLEMAVRRPKSSYALGEIRGVGPMKIEKYGEQFLALLRAADETEAA